MKIVKCIFLLCVLGLMVKPDALMAAPDLTGTWTIGIVSSSTDALELEQKGQEVTAKQRDSDIAAVLGGNMFEANLSGNVLKGRFATVLQSKEAVEFCGRNAYNWVNLELVLTSDGNRLEGKWERNKQSVSIEGCPLISNDWKPFTLYRTTPQKPIKPTSAPKPKPKSKKVVPPPVVEPAPLPPVVPVVAPPPIVPVPLPPVVEPAPSSKSALIGMLSLLGLALVFFFIRNAYVNYLVGSHKRSPNNAGLAGWGLFGGLLFGSAIGSVAMANSALLTMPVIAGLAALSLGCFVLCFVVSKNK